jgi:hypothetical protein
LSERSSQNSSNWYTLILDNHPKFKDFPKRSKSLICATKYKIADNYGGGNVIAVIPFNSAKIGWINAPDIWYVPVNFYKSETIKSMNDFFDNIKSYVYELNDKNWESFIEFDKRLKTDEKLRSELIDELAVFGIHGDVAKDWLDHFLKHVFELYDIKDFELLKPAQLKSRQEYFDNTSKKAARELWVGGKVLCLNKKIFFNLCEQLKEE